MSFIRTLSNPEKLYIFGSRNDVIEIYPGDNLNGFRVKGSDFFDILKMYHEDPQDFPYETDTLHMSEDKDFRYVLTKIETFVDPEREGMSTRHTIVAKMYPVTWEYIYHNWYFGHENRWLRLRDVLRSILPHWLHWLVGSR